MADLEKIAETYGWRDWRKVVMNQEEVIKSLRVALRKAEARARDEREIREEADKENQWFQREQHRIIQGRVALRAEMEDVKEWAIAANVVREEAEAQRDDLKQLRADWEPWLTALSRLEIKYKITRFPDDVERAFEERDAECGRAEAAEQEIEEHRQHAQDKHRRADALADYVQHRGACPAGEAPHTTAYGKCTCGLSRALAGEPREVSESKFLASVEEKFRKHGKPALDELEAWRHDSRRRQ